MNSQPDSPLYLSREELQSFNQLWQELSEEDREQLTELMRRVRQIRAVETEGSVTPFHTLLLRILLEEQREIRRLKQRLKDLQQG